MEKKNQIKKNSYIIAACILASRILGLLREMLFASLLGTTIYSDALRAAIRIPNFLQNLFGEGVLSASFIPVYSRLRVSSNKEEATVVAKEVGRLLLWLVLFLSVIGLLANSLFVNLFAGGFSEEAKELTEFLIIYIFPATSLLVLSAWCLGVLNSHRYFALSYSAPIGWNLTIILGLFFFSKGKSLIEISIFAAQLFLLGSLVQFLVQLPSTLKLIKSKESNIKLFSLKTSQATKEVMNNFPPVILGRGLIQISAYLDTIIASFLAPGSLSALMYAQTLYLTPISLFGLSNAAAALPELSESDPKNADSLTKQKIALEIQSTFRRILFYCVPTILVLTFLGLKIITLLLERGSFTHQSSIIVYLTLISFLPGLIPSTWSRVITSLLFASGQQKKVARVSFIRLCASAILTFIFCFILLPNSSLHASFYVAGIGLAASLSSIVEIILLSRLALETSGINPLAIIFRRPNLN